MTMIPAETAETAETAEVVTVPEAAAILHISRNVAYTLTRQWRATGGRAGLPCIKVGRSVRVPRADLDRIIRSAHPSEDSGHQVA